MKKINTIYLSTTFAKDNSKISDVLRICKQANITNIELGSNHVYENNFKKIIKKYNFNFIIHNYFPIPKKNFVVNIASSNKKIRNLSLKHIKKAILFCKATNSSLYTFHPGFLNDPISASRSKSNYDFIWEEKKIKKNYELAYKQMIVSLNEIVRFAKKQKVKIAIETEGSYKKRNYLLMQKPNEYKELFKYFKSKDLGINLNLGHLNLAAKAFKFSKHNFVELIKKYVVALELSDNNGLEDEHLPLKKNKWYWKIIDDPYFDKTYKILEFRNTNIKKVKKVINFFK